MDSTIQSKIEETRKHFLDSLLVDHAEAENSVQDTKEGIIKQEIFTNDSDMPSSNVDSDDKIKDTFKTEMNKFSVKDLNEDMSNSHNIIPDAEKNKVLKVKLKKNRKSVVRDSKNLEPTTEASKKDTTEQIIPTGVDSNNSVQDSKEEKMGIKKNDKEIKQEKFIDESTKENTKIRQTANTNSVDDSRRKIGAKKNNKEIKKEKFFDENEIRETAMKKPNTTNSVDDSQPETITRKIKSIKQEKIIHESFKENTICETAKKKQHTTNIVQDSQPETVTKKIKSIKKEKIINDSSKENAIRETARKKPHTTNSVQDSQPESVTRKIKSIKQEKIINNDSSKENTTDSSKTESKPPLMKKKDGRGRPPGSKNKVHEDVKMEEERKENGNGTDFKIADAGKKIRETAKKKPHTKNSVQDYQPERGVEMIKSIKQEKNTEDPTKEDDAKMKKQSVEDSSLELALEHSRELLIIKKEISDSYNDQENNDYNKAGKRKKIKQEPNNEELDLIDQEISTTAVGSKDGNILI